MKKLFLTYWPDLLCLILLLLIFWVPLDLSLIWAHTHVAGGDMISHPWMVKSLLAGFKEGTLWRWNQGWFAGYPQGYFYFYPPYFMAAFFELVGISDAVSFKLAVWLIVSSVPVIGFFAFRFLLPTLPALFLALVSLTIFHNEAYSFWGGNFKSVLAGQISHQFGLNAALLVFGLLESKRHRSWLFTLAYTGALLAHVYTAVFTTLLVAAYALPLLRDRKKFLEFAKTPLAAVFLAAFWWLPFLAYRHWTVAPINFFRVDWNEVVNVLQFKAPFFLALYALAIISFAIAIWRKKGNVVGWLILVSLISVPFLLLNLEKTPFLHIRLAPHFYQGALFLCGWSLYRWDWSKKWVLGISAGAAFVMALLLIVPQSPLKPKETPFWWVWNMRGIEQKDNANLVREVWDRLKQIQDHQASRVLVEYADYNTYGSPRIFELTPYFSNQPVMEGLLLESSSSFGHYYFMMKKITARSWWPGFHPFVPAENVAEGVKNFGKYNVRYLVAYTAEMKNTLTRLGYGAIFRNAAFDIFAVNNESRVASIFEGDLPELRSPQPMRSSVFLQEQSVQNYYRLVTDSSAPEPARGTLPTPKKQELKPIEGQWDDSGQNFHIPQTQASAASPQKILLKIPYFPNWHASSGEELFPVSPNLMMIDTASPELTISYRVGWPEKISVLLSLLALLYLLFEIGPVRHRAFK